MKGIIAKILILVWILVMGVPCGLAEHDSSALEQQWLDVMRDTWINGDTDVQIEEIMQISDALVRTSGEDWLAYAFASEGYSGASFYYRKDPHIRETSKRYYEEFLKLTRTTTQVDILKRDSTDLVKGYACCIYAMEQQPDKAISINEIAADLLSGDALQILPYEGMLMVYLGGHPNRPYNYELYIYYAAVESEFYQHPKIQETCKRVIECEREVLPQDSDPSFREARCYYGICASAFLAYSAYCENDCEKLLQYMNIADEFLEDYRELDGALQDGYSSLPVMEMYSAHLHLLYAQMLHDDSEVESSYNHLKQILQILNAKPMDFLRIVPGEVTAIDHSIDSLLIG